MHYLMKVLFDKERAENSLEARKLTVSLLEKADFIRKINFDPCDSFLIGGDWTGWLTTQLLDKEKLLQFHDEVKTQYGWDLSRVLHNFNLIENSEKKTKSVKIFLKYFPAFLGEPPFFRKIEYLNSDFFGFDDDAQLIENERMFYKWVGKHEGQIYDHDNECLYAIDLDNTVISPENTIGKKWVVLVDSHR